MKNKLKYLLVLFVIIGTFAACDNFLTPSVDQVKTIDTGINNVEELQSAVLGAVGRLNSTNLYGRNFIVSPEVMTDNSFSNAHSGRFIAEDQLNFTENSGLALGLWNNFYGVIAAANLAIHAEFESTTQVDDIKGQAYAIRALAHMNLLTIFSQQYVTSGDQSLGIPYITEYGDGELSPPRQSVSEVWNRIGQDLQTAVDLMDENRFADRTLMNYWAARALQTRYFLYTEEYDNLIDAAEEIINSGHFSISPEDSYVSEWNSGIPESLFELALTSTDRTGINGIAYIYLDTEYGDVSISDDLYESYEDGDVRTELYSPSTQGEIDFWRMTGKFTDPLGSDNIPVIRYSEVILNYAEALAQNPATEPLALIELNKITENRNAPAYTTGTLENVWTERRLELAMEGHRLYDLVRTGREIPVGDSDSFRSEVIPVGDYRTALPIPNAELRANSNMVQNDGY